MRLTRAECQLIRVLFRDVSLSLGLSAFEKEELLLSYNRFYKLNDTVFKDDREIWMNYICDLVDKCL